MPHLSRRSARKGKGKMIIPIGRSWRIKRQGERAAHYALQRHCPRAERWSTVSRYGTIDAALADVLDVRLLNECDAQTVAELRDYIGTVRDEIAAAPV